MSKEAVQYLNWPTAKPTIQAAIYARYSSVNQNSESANDQIQRILYYLERNQIQSTSLLD